MPELLESYIGKLRALSSILTAKSFMINIEDYRMQLRDLVKELIVTVKEVERFLKSSVTTKKEASISNLSKLESILAEYLSFITDKTIKPEKLVNISSEKLTAVIQLINDFTHDSRLIESYSVTIEEIYFLKNKLSYTERLEKELIPTIKTLSGNLKEKENRISKLVEQLDAAEQNIFNIQAELNTLIEEKEVLQERIQELLSKNTTHEYDESSVSKLKDENKKLNETIEKLKKKIAQMETKIEPRSYQYEQQIKTLREKLKQAKKNYLDKLSVVVEERNVWRAKAIDNTVYTIEEAINEIKEKIIALEKENRELISENERLTKELSSKIK
ncbi:MAG: hypothetical protein ACTSQY_07850 [Candidatus Odinarchaeia archaeon]